MVIPNDIIDSSYPVYRDWQVGTIPIGLLFAEIDLIRRLAGSTNE